MSVSSNSRIAKNTVLMYLRMLIVMAINLWTVRFVLKALGEVDYGIYDVVAGIVAMIHSISSILSSSTQRFYSFYLGKESSFQLKKVFTACVNIFVAISLLTLFVGELAGTWFVNTQLTIPDDRMLAANWVFHLSLLSLIFLLLTTPYSAVVIAQEDMGIFAVVSIVECFLKFLLALWIRYVVYDRLILYGCGMMGISLLVLFSYIWIVHRKYKNYQYCKISIEKRLYKEILSFSGWVFTGSIAGLSLNQISSILVNVFFGPVINAARAISFQIHNIINSFCGSFLTAIRPPMIKAYAQEDYNRLNTIFSLSNKFIYYCMMMISLPLFLDMETLLSVWLDTNRIETVLFSRLMLIYVFLLSLSNPITFVIHATGHVKEYHLLVEIPTVLCAPVTYILFKMGLPAFTTYIVMVVAVLISHIFRLYSVKKWYPSFSFSSYMKEFLLPALFISLLVIPVVCLANQFISYPMLRIAVTIVLSVLLFAWLGFLIGTTQYEKEYFYIMAGKIMSKLKN